MKRKALMLAAIVMLGLLAACGAGQPEPVNGDAPITMEAVTTSAVSDARKAETEPTSTGAVSESTESMTEVQETPTEPATRIPASATPASVTTLTSKPTQPPITTTKPKPVTTTAAPTTTAAAFDINYWVQYAKDYGKSIGLIPLPDAKSCWDTPIIAGGTGKYLERDIKSRLTRYAKEPEISYFNVWAEKRPDGDYDLYIAYA